MVKRLSNRMWNHTTHIDELWPRGIPHLIEALPDINQGLCTEL
jgi:hypothetical protein